MSTKDYPRLLIVNAGPIGALNGTGITLKNLFSEWPKEKILQICYCDPSTETLENSPDFEVFPKWTIPIDHLFRSFYYPTKTNKRVLVQTPVNPSLKTRGIKNSLHDFVRAMLDSSPVILPKSTLKCIDEFKPEVIYSNLASIRLMKTIKQLTKRYNIKPIVHIMDDWPTTMYTSSFLNSWANQKINNKLQEIIQTSACSLTISNLMALEYEKRYRGKFFWAANPIDVNLSDYVLPKENKSKTLTYCGGLHLGRWKSIREIGEELDKLNENLSKWNLRIYTREKDWLQHIDEFKSIKSISWGGELNPEDVKMKLISSDVLIHVESFDNDIIQYTKYSFSTKIPEYMSVGRPILAYGPDFLASTKYIKENKIGIVAKDKKQLKNALTLMTQDSQLRLDLGKNGFDKALKEVSKDSISDKLYKVAYMNKNGC